jgi:hypothetical protein
VKAGEAWKLNEVEKLPLNFLAPHSHHSFPVCSSICLHLGKLRPKGGPTDNPGTRLKPSLGNAKWIPLLHQLLGFNFRSDFFLLPLLSHMTWFLGDGVEDGGDSAKEASEGAERYQKF